MDDLEDLGGAMSSDGVRVTRDLPPVVKVRARANRGGGGGGGGGGVGGGGARAAANTNTANATRAEGATAAAAAGSTAATSRKDDVVDDGAADDEDAKHASTTTVVPGTATVHVKTFGCSHNISDSEFMAGQLSAYGYTVSNAPEEADVWVVNTCTVKNPSQSAMNTVITKGKAAGKKLVIAGCVPQGDKNAKELDGLSLVGVTQIDRIVEAVERTLEVGLFRLHSTSHFTFTSS